MSEPPAPANPTPEGPPVLGEHLPPRSGTPAAHEPAGESGFSLRAVSLGFLFLAAWVFVINSSYPDSFFRLQQLVMLMGFGALLTLFFVKFLLGLLPAALRLRPPETAVFFTMLLIGIPSSMLGRLALESAYANHLVEVGDNRAGQRGFVPAHWAPEAHVRLPEHRNMVEPLSDAEKAAAPQREASIQQAADAVLRAQDTYHTVLLEYLFQQKPDLAEAWNKLAIQNEAHLLQEFNLQSSDSTGTRFRRFGEIIGDKPMADKEPAWRKEIFAFRKAFREQNAAAVEIFSALNDVVIDAKRFATYAKESDHCPLAQVARTKAAEAAKKAGLNEAAIAAAGDAAAAPVAKEEACRAALVAVSCADSLEIARADISTRLTELAENYAAIQGIYTGEGQATTYAVPWKLWLGPMAFWAAVMLAFHGLAFAFLLSMRKVWVEAERLPFPFAILPERLEQGVPLQGSGPGVPEQQSVFPRWWLYLPFLVGLALCLPHCFELSAQTINPPPPGPTNHLTDLSVEGWDIKLNVDTWTLALILLFPLDLIFTALVFYFLGAYAAPYLARACGVEGFGQNLIPYQMLRMGGFLGLFLGTVWFNRRTMRELVTGRAAQGGGEAERTAAARDPLKPALVTVVFWTCLLLLTGLMLWGETGGGVTKVLLFLFGLFVVVVYNFQEWRIRAEGGFVAWDFNNIMKVQTWSNWYVFGQHHTNQDPATQLPLPQSPMAWQQLYNTGLLGTYVPTLGPGAYFLEAFRIGDIFRASPKAILKAALLAFLFALVVGMPIYLACTYHYGLGQESMHSIWFNFGHSSDKIFRYYMKRGDGGPFGTASTALSGWAFVQEILLGNNWRNTFLWTVAGAACVIVIMYYRRNVARFPFHPLGFILAGQGGSSTQMDVSTIWFAYLLALIIKWVIHDWFGVRVFRTKVEPGITYLILGLCTGILIYVILVVVKLHMGVTWLEHGG